MEWIGSSGIIYDYLYEKAAVSSFATWKGRMLQLGTSFQPTPPTHTPPPLLKEKKFTGLCYSPSYSPCRLMNVRIPVMVGRSSIHGNSILRRSLAPEDSSSLISIAPLFPRRDQSPNTRFVKERQLLLSQDALDACAFLRAGRS